MGLVQSCFRAEEDEDVIAGNATENPEKKQYSWDQKRQDQSKFIIENLTNGEESGRRPGEIGGQQFMVRNCVGANIYLFDHIDTVSIDDCKKCNIFVGPTKNSLFIRDCSDCSVVALCGQFRTRDCSKLNLFLSCPTQPIIEETKTAKFGCVQYSYDGLLEQMFSAGLSPFDNLWWNIHDFTPDAGKPNWSTIGEMYKVHDFLEAPTSENLKDIQISTEREKSVVPLTLGQRRRDHDETALVLSFADAQQTSRCQRVIRDLDGYAEIELIRTRCIKLQDSDVDRILGSKEFRSRCEKGPLVALQFGGPDCVAVCRKVSSAVAEETGSQGHLLSSGSKEQAEREANALFSLADMQLGI